MASRVGEQLGHARFVGAALAKVGRHRRRQRAGMALQGRAQGRQPGAALGAGRIRLGLPGGAGRAQGVVQLGRVVSSGALGIWYAPFERLTKPSWPCCPTLPYLFVLSAVVRLARIAALVL